MTDKLRSNPKIALRHIAGSYTDRPAVLWPGGDKQGSQKGVKPVAEALVIVASREADLAAGQLDEVQLLLQDGEESNLKMHVRVEAHIYNTGGFVAATAGEIKMAKEMNQEAVLQVYDHYLKKYGGEFIYLLSRKDMEDTAATIPLEDARQEDS